MWNRVAMFAPAAGLLLGVALASMAKGQGLADGIGGFFGGAIVLAAICTVGEAAAIVALYRAEQPRWLAGVMALVNGVLMLPGIWVLARMDWD